MKKSAAYTWTFTALGVVFGTNNIECDNWEPRISKLDKCLSGWKKRSLSLIGKVLVLNILGLSKLLFFASVLAPPRWVFRPSQSNRLPHFVGLSHGDSRP